MKKIYWVFIALLVVTACGETTEEQDEVEEVITTEDQIVEDSVETTDATNLEDIDPKELAKAFSNGEEKFDFYAVFTEPFWAIYIIKDVVVFDRADGPTEAYHASAPFNADAETQEISFSKDDQKWILKIEASEGSDGMSDIKYPYSVSLNDEYHGGGATKFQNENYDQ